MEIALLLAGLILGVLVTFAVVWVRDRVQRAALLRHERRELYARALGLHDATYGLVDFLVTWPRRVNQTAQPVPGERPTTRAASIVNNASVELDAAIRRSQDAIALIQLIGSAAVVQRAKDMQTAQEKAVLALRVDTPARLDHNWSVVGPAWRTARQKFAETARHEVGVDQ